ncbi:MAG: 50S ribosomal protein L35 [Candidatus Cloacimonetes bacterium]|nr:50S ribosomal protein L35 [Candidatus Cloacimonadota bacterium]
MPKMKSRKGAVKRFKMSATGKIKREHAYLGHILTKKTRKRKRQLRQAGYVVAADVPRVRKMISS